MHHMHQCYNLPILNLLSMRTMIDSRNNVIVNWILMCEKEYYAENIFYPQ